MFQLAYVDFLGWYLFPILHVFGTHLVLYEDMPRFRCGEGSRIFFYFSFIFML